MIKELEDQEWFPGILRRYQAGFIGSVACWLRLYRPLVPVLQRMIDPLPRITDLCTGSGLPAIDMHRQLRGITITLLTDKFPCRIDTPDGVQTWDEPLDILAFQSADNCVYTMYNAFHHFNAAQQRQLLQQMANARAGFLFAEVLTPTIFDAVKILLMTTVGQLLLAPFIQPFSWKRLILTYLIPVNLITVLFDGLVSVAKSHKTSYYQNMVNTLTVNDYRIFVEKNIRWTGTLTTIRGEAIT